MAGLEITQERRKVMPVSDSEAPTETGNEIPIQVKMGMMGEEAFSPTIFGRVFLHARFCPYREIDACEDLL